MNNKYREIIANCARIDISPTNIKDDHILIDDLGYDSISFVTMIIMLEEVYDFTFDDENISTDIMQTVKNITDYISSKIKEREN